MTALNSQPNGLMPRGPSAGNPKAIAAAVGLGFVGLVLAYMGQSIGGVLVVLILVAGVVGAGILLRNPDWMLPIMIYSLWFEGVRQGQISTGRVVALLIPLIAAGRMASSSWRPPALKPRAWVSTFLVMVWAWATGLWALSVGGAAGWFQQFLLVTLGIMFWLGGAIYTDGPEQIERLFKHFVWIGFPIAVISTVLFFTVDNRVFGFTGGPNEFAALMVSAIPFMVMYARREVGRRRWAYWSMIPFALVAVVSTGSRGGLIGLGVAGVWGILTLPGVGGTKRVRNSVVGFGFMTIGYLFAAILQPERFAPQVLLGQGDRGAGRLDIFDAAMQAVGDNWQFGLGMGGFASNSIYFLQVANNAALERLEGTEIVESGGISAHNLYLQLILDMGVIGTVFYLSVFGLMAWNLWTLRHTRWRDLCWVFSVVIVLFLFRGILGASINNKLTWLSAGIMGSTFVNYRYTMRRGAGRSPTSDTGPDTDAAELEASAPARTS